MSTESLSIKVPREKKLRLKALALQRNTSLTQLMLQALDRLAEESTAEGAASCYDLARDLFETPDKLGASKEGDRSTNKNRLKSFGRKPVR